MSKIRQNYHEECEALINKQINMEFYASYVYLSMSSFFNRDDQALHGFASFFKKSSNEEREHGMKLMEYQTKRGGKVVFQDIAPLRAAGLGNVLEDNLPSTLGLIFHQLHTVLALFIGALLEEGSKAMKGLVIPVEERRHGEIDIASIELHVDLLVDQCLALFMVVLSDLRTHLVNVVVVAVVVGGHP